MFRLFLFFLMIRRPPRSTLFPYTTLFRSSLFSQSGPRLRISMIPTTDAGKMLREAQPLVDYLEKKTGTKIVMTIPTNYAAVVEAMVNDQVDIAHFGGFTFVQISARAGAKPLVRSEERRVGKECRSRWSPYH